MQKEEKTEDYHPKGKNKTKLIVVPLTGNHVQTRQSKLEHKSQKKRKEISNRHKRTRGHLRTNSLANPSGSFYPE